MCLQLLNLVWTPHPAPVLACLLCFFGRLVVLVLIGLVVWVSVVSKQARQAAGQMLEGFKDRADGMPYALYILQTPSPRHTDQVSSSGRTTALLGVYFTGTLSAFGVVLFVCRTAFAFPARGDATRFNLRRPNERVHGRFRCGTSPSTPWSTC